MKWKRAATVATVLAAALLAACGTSPEAKKAAARANAEKYYELIKAGNYEGAYRATLSNAHKASLPIETFVRYHEKFAGAIGPLGDYQLMQSDLDERTGTVLLTYSLTVGERETPVTEVVKLSQQGAEWRIDSVEPKSLGQHSSQPAAPRQGAPQPAAPQPAAPQPAAPQQPRQ